MMKKVLLLSLIMSVMLTCFSITSYCEEVIGETSVTDIIAFIDYYSIPSFNINGNTAILVEHLSEYGFDVTWNGDTRSLTINDNVNKKYTPIKMGEYFKYFEMFIGKTDIYKSDISTYLNGKPMLSLNLGGVTAIYLDDLNAVGELRWNGEKRYINLLKKDKNYPFDLSNNTVNKAKFWLKTYGNTVKDERKLKDTKDKYGSSSVKAEVYLITPVIGAANYFYSQLGNGVDLNDLQIGEYFDYIRATQTLQFWVFLTADTEEELNTQFEFCLMQKNNFYKNINLSVDSVTTKVDGRYKKSFSTFIPTYNAIDFSKSIDFIMISRSSNYYEVHFPFNVSDYLDE